MDFQGVADDYMEFRGIAENQKKLVGALRILAELPMGLQHELRRLVIKNRTCFPKTYQIGKVTLLRTDIYMGTGNSATFRVEVEWKDEEKQKQVSVFTAVLYSDRTALILFDSGTEFGEYDG
jgi:hypothetical protein